jgi:hypothetical protein
MGMRIWGYGDGDGLWCGVWVWCYTCLSSFMIDSKMSRA